MVVHADGRTMAVVIEPLSEVSKGRIPLTAEACCIRRLDGYD
jgi:hypothetical protein